MRLTKDADAVIDSLEMDSLQFEAMEILKQCPEGTKVKRAPLARAAWSYQTHSDLQRSVEEYLHDVGRVYLGNSFSLNMLDPEQRSVVEVLSVEADCVPPTAESVVGHADTAALFCRVLGFPVEFNRATLRLQCGDTLFVGQYSGPRLEEGTYNLPLGATVKWLRVFVR